MEELNYDVVVIGGGPSGVTAGLYCERSGLKTVILEKSAVGGQVINTYEIKNFPGFTKISGPDFAMKLNEQLAENEIEVLYEEVFKVDFTNKLKKIFLKDKILVAKAVIICVGAKVKPLGLENEENLIGKGISYCAICDGNFFRNKTACVVGGGDSAVEDSTYLSGICEKVFVLVRKNEFKAQKVLVESLMSNKKQKNNIEILYNTEVKEIIGENNLEEIKVVNNQTRKEEVLKTDALFVAIGRIPATEFLKEQVLLNDYGYIVVNEKLETNIKGVFAGGDCINRDVKQIITASGFGALCATYANNYIKENF